MPASVRPSCSSVEDFNGNRKATQLASALFPIIKSTLQRKGIKKENNTYLRVCFCDVEDKNRSTRGMHIILKLAYQPLLPYGLTKVNTKIRPIENNHNYLSHALFYLLLYHNTLNIYINYHYLVVLCLVSVYGLSHANKLPQAYGSCVAFPLEYSPMFINP